MKTTKQPYTEPSSDMTPAQFRDARLKLGISYNGAAKLFGLGERGSRTVQRWESGDRAIPWYVGLVLGAYLTGKGKLPKVSDLRKYKAPEIVATIIEAYQSGGALPDLEPFKRQPSYFARRAQEKEE